MPLLQAVSCPKIQAMNSLLSRLTSLFPLWAVAVSVWAYGQPTPWTTLKPLIIPLLGLVMFGMGLTLVWGDFRRVFKRPGVIGLGMLAQFGVMPLLAFGLSHAFGLSPQLTAGMVLVGCVSGGTASNVITFLAKGDTALSITLTFCSTLAAVLLTPLLTWLYLHQTVQVPVIRMLLSILKMVLLPVLAGTTINGLWGSHLKRLQPLFPLISVTAIVLIIGIVIGLNQARLSTLTPLLVLAVMLHNLGGMACGYGIGTLAGCSKTVRRTLAIEVGMQNSGLAVALATTYFSAAAALPGALFSVWHNLAGSALASWWNRKAAREESALR
jgi:bile acid:Na+ symporter, BASS family